MWPFRRCELARDTLGTGTKSMSLGLAQACPAATEIFDLSRWQPVQTKRPRPDRPSPDGTLESAAARKWQANPARDRANGVAEVVYVDSSLRPFEKR